MNGSQRVATVPCSQVALIFKTLLLTSDKHLNANDSINVAFKDPFNTFNLKTAEDLIK